MFIQTEETPNPEALKFLPGRIVMESGSAEILSADEAQKSPLAMRLFRIDGVQSVFFGSEFITVTKQENVDWGVLKPSILASIMEFYLSHEPLFSDKNEKNESSDETQDPIVLQIKEILDTRIRPAVAMDGGDIVFDKFEEGVLYLRMQGSCSGCPSSSATLKTGIENMMRHYIPEVEEVRAV